MNLLEQLDSGMNTDLSLTNEAKSFLLTTSKWAKFLAILGFVLIGLMAIASVIMFLMPAAALNNMGLIIGGFYFVFAVIYFFPTMYLFRFATKIREGIENNSTDLITVGFENLKSCFKFIGISTIVGIGAYIGILLIAGIFAGVGI